MFSRQRVALFSALLFAIEKLACSNLAQKVLCSIRARYFFQVAILKPVFSSTDLLQVLLKFRKQIESSLRLQWSFASERARGYLTLVIKKHFGDGQTRPKQGRIQASQHSLKKMKVYSRNHKTFAGWLGGAQAVAYLVQVSNYLPNNRRHKRACTHLKR